MGKITFLKFIGGLLIVIGVLILLNASSNQLFSIAYFGSGGITVTDIPPLSATRIFIGVVSIILGLVVFLGKEIINLFMRFKK